MTGSSRSWSIPTGRMRSAKGRGPRCIYRTCLPRIFGSIVREEGDNMKRSVLLAGIVLAVGGLRAQSYVPEYGNSSVKVKPVVTIRATPFSIKDVRLLDGPFREAMEADARYLLIIDPDRLLSEFRAHAGLTPRAAKYGGWESSGLAGHTLGHYLSACSMQYASTGDTVFLHRVNYIVSELEACATLRSGYV